MQLVIQNGIILSQFQESQLFFIPPKKYSTKSSKYRPAGKYYIMKAFGLVQHSQNGFFKDGTTRFNIKEINFKEMFYLDVQTKSYSKMGCFEESLQLATLKWRNSKSRYTPCKSLVEYSNLGPPGTNSARVSFTIRRGKWWRDEIDLMIHES